MHSSKLLLVFACLLALANCGGDDNKNNDPDTDSDGVVDSLDAFPNDPNETADSDSDGVGDNADNCDQANEDQHDADGDGLGDVCEATYAFSDADGNNTVSYTGQTARHMLIEELVVSMNNLQRGDVRELADLVSEEFNLIYQNYDAATDTVNALDSTAITYSIADGDTLITNTDTPADLTLGSISTAKNLDGKIAGADKCFHLLVDGEDAADCADGSRGEFFGWDLGLDADTLVRTPEDLVQYFFTRIAEEATSDELATIATLENDNTAIDKPTLSAFGHDYRQLAQKFLLGAVTFSQGTADYLQSDFGSEEMLALEEDKAYTGGQHNWDEAFGYYGAARNAASYTDNEARADSGRIGFANGYNDLNGDNLIDVRSEIMLGNATNCAKRDAGATVATQFTETAFDAFIAGRQILQDAGDAGELTAAQQTGLDAAILSASVTWEKCIAATVVHYINDVIADMGEYSEGKFVDLTHFSDLAKHWSEMKGFALGLQFNPLSPFRTDGSGVTVTDLKMVLSLMGDAPVLADDTQAGEAFEGGAAAYIDDLLEARDILANAYGFAAENAENW